jgi:hypothetical protein
LNTSISNTTGIYYHISIPSLWVLMFVPFHAWFSS